MPLAIVFIQFVQQSRTPLFIIDKFGFDKHRDMLMMVSIGGHTKMLPSFSHTHTHNSSKSHRLIIKGNYIAEI